MTAPIPSDDIYNTLGLSPGRRRRRLGRWAIGILVLIVASAGLLQLRAAGDDAAPRFRTEEVEKGTLTVSVAATGELKPLTQVNIGTEISGIVESVAEPSGSKAAR